MDTKNTLFKVKKIRAKRYLLFVSDKLKSVKGTDVKQFFYEVVFESMETVR